jgi:hypothetical protein
MNLYQLAEDLKVSPKILRRWIKKSGLGNGSKITHKVEQQARTHFIEVSGPMATALETERSGLGKILRHEEQVESQKAIKVKGITKHKWAKVQRDSESIIQKDSSTQKDFFRALRHGKSSDNRSSESSSTRSQIDQKIHQHTSTPANLGNKKNNLPIPSILPASKPATQRTKPHSNAQTKSHSNAQTKSHSNAQNKKIHRSESTDHSSTKSTEQSNEFIQVYYKKEFDLLHQRYHSLQAEYKQLQNKHKELSNKPEKPLKKEPILPPIIRQINLDHNQHLHAFFREYGLEGYSAIEVLIELLQHPIRGRELLYSLQHHKVQEVMQGFELCCASQVCEDVAIQIAHIDCIEVEEHLCSICQGSEARRWYKRLLLAAVTLGYDRIVLVGGSNDDHSLLRNLAKEHEGIKWNIVLGSQSVNQTVVNQKMKSSDAIVLCSAMYLPHSLSGLFKTASQSYKIPCFAIEPGKRSIKNLCKDILKAWKIDVEDA